MDVVKKLLCLILMLSFFSSNVIANDHSSKTLLRIKLKEEAWVQATDVGLKLSVSTTGKSEELAKKRSELMANLKKLADTSWHVTNYARSEDKTGLERNTIFVEARVKESKLGSITSQIKKMNKPGVKYEIDDVDFVPSTEAKQQVRQMLRERLYKRSKEEIKRASNLLGESQLEIKSIME